MVSRAITACVLIIGNEILSGRTPDSNLNHIARTLGSWGIQLREARVIPDLEAEIVAALNETRRRYDYVFTTGGIGPTHDDITAEAVAKALGRPLATHLEIAERIRRRPAAPQVMASRLRMARVPEGAGLIDNPAGPQGFRIGNVYVMAGIPGVMQAMLASLEGKLETGPLVRSRAVTAYLSESHVADALTEIQAEFQDLDLGSYPFFRDGRYGTSLVMRGVDEARLDLALEAICRAIADAGEAPQDIRRD